MKLEEKETPFKVRLIIDGVMILSMAGLLYGVGGWVSEMSVTLKSIRENQEIIRTNQTALIQRVASVEVSVPNMPITKDADKRITAVEATQAAQYQEIISRLGRIENAIDKNNDEKR